MNSESDLIFFYDRKFFGHGSDKFSNMADISFSCRQPSRDVLKVQNLRL